MFVFGSEIRRAPWLPSYIAIVFLLLLTVALVRMLIVVFLVVRV